MRITRAAKVAAFPLIVLALVALVACTGPAGVAGKDATATTGPIGPMGDPGTNALSPAPTDGPRKIINMDADSTSAIDLSIGYFTGGQDPITYKVKSTDPDPIPEVAGITLEDISGSMLPLKVIAIEAGDTAGFAPIVVTIEATDADNRFAENTVTIKRNRKPTLTNDIVDIVVGVQEGDRPDSVPGCATLNVCIRDGFADADAGDELTYTINTEVVSVSANDDTKTVGDVKITGLTATTEAMMVKITAMDENGLTVDSNEFSLAVNAAPTVKRAIAPVNLPSRGSAEEKMVVFVVDSHFEDSDDLSFALVTDEKKAHDGEVATVVVSMPSGQDENTTVTVTSQGAGDTMVYLKATEETDNDDTGIGQSVEASFMVTVD